MTTVAQPSPFHRKQNSSFNEMQFPIPLNIRDILKAAADPLLVNWPSDISRKNNGVPIRKYTQKYGIIKAPVTNNRFIFLRKRKKLPPPFLNARKRWNEHEISVIIDYLPMYGYLQTLPRPLI